MNISKAEQRVLHALAQGGCIDRQRDARGRISAVLCVTREGFILSDCTVEVFNKLRRKRLVESKASGPYRISHAGRLSVRPQLDNR
jgi:uncharacterized protein